jgi:hypothetical protein
VQTMRCIKMFFAINGYFFQNGNYFVMKKCFSETVFSFNG